MTRIKTLSRGALARGALAGSALCLAGIAPAYAQAEDSVSGSLGMSYNSHFVSYGLDVWGGGDDFYSDESTTFVWGDFAWDLDPVTINAGFWSDINNNVPSAIGGHIQEVDVYLGASVGFGPATAGITYQAWSYASDVEEVVDLSLGFDDTGLLIDNVAFNPKLVWHFRVHGNGAQEEGSAIVLSVGPSFPLTEMVSLTIPAGIAFFLDDDFQGGTDGGYGYSYLGGSVGYTLPFSGQYGTWSLNFDLIAYFTDSDAIPGNPDETFLTGSLGLKVAI